MMVITKNPRNFYEAGVEYFGGCPLLLFFEYNNFITNQML
jgi:hypothetical protein